MDLGAIEFGSSLAPPLILPILSNQSTEFAGLALANAFYETLEISLLAYDRQGQAMGTYEKEIEPGCQLAFLLGEAFPALKEGWIEIRSTGPDLMNFTLLGDYDGTLMDGAALAGASHRNLLFSEVRNQPGEQTRFYLINPHEGDLDVTLQWRRPDGSTVEQLLQLVRKGMFSGTLNDLFGTGSGSGGYVTAKAERLLFGIQIFGSPQSRGGLLALDLDAKNPGLFAAHLASGPEVETTLNLINTGPVTDILLEALDEKGDVIASRLLEDFPQGAQYRKQAGEIFDFDSETVVGWLRITTTNGTLSGNISFGDPSDNFLAALPLQGAAQGAREFLLSHVAQTAKMSTGVTLLNPFQRVALVSLEVFDTEKNLTGLSFLELSPREKVARLLNEFLPSLQEQGGGFIRIRSNVPIFAFELFGRYSLDFLAAVPQQVVVH